MFLFDEVFDQLLGAHAVFGGKSDQIVEMSWKPT
jgi:hypothetical protein